MDREPAEVADVRPCLVVGEPANALLMSGLPVELLQYLYGKGEVPAPEQGHCTFLLWRISWASANRVEEHVRVDEAHRGPRWT